MSVGNGTVECGIVLDQLVFIDPSESLRLFSIAEIVLIYVFVIGSLAWWWRHRKRPFLAKRSFPLVCLTALGVLFLFTATCLQRIDENLPCEAYAFLYISSFILTFWPMTVRILRVFHRIRYDSALVEMVAKETGFDYDFQPALDDPRLKRLRFRATAFATSLVTIIPLTVDLIGSAAIAIVECNCLLGFVEARVVAVFLLGAIFIIIVNVIVLAYIRGRPDPLLLARETEIAWLVSGALAVVAIILIRVDPGQFVGREDSPWSWMILLDWSFFMFFVIIGPLPVAISATPGSKYQDDDNLGEFLEKDDAALKCFTRYLATELSVENILFFSEAREWRKEYEGLDYDIRQKQAEHIYQKYFTRSSEFEINISAMQAESVHAVFKNNKTAERDVFTDSMHEVYLLMSRDSFPRFKKSALYKLYLGTLGPGEEMGVLRPMDI